MLGVHTHVALSATRGKASPSFFFSPVFQPCFELVFWQLLRNNCSFWFFLQVPINRQATEGKIKKKKKTIPIPKSPVCNLIERELRELKREEKNRE